MKIYLASSWRNAYQPDVVGQLRGSGHDVYDFRHPAPGDKGFHWSEIDQGWREWSVPKYRIGLGHPLAVCGFNNDFSAMQTADACVLVLPCGRSAHLEAGWFVGAGKPLLIYVPPPERIEPELMYKLARLVSDDIGEVIGWLERQARRQAAPPGVRCASRRVAEAAEAHQMGKGVTERIKNARPTVDN